MSKILKLNYFRLTILNPIKSSIKCKIEHKEFSDMQTTSHTPSREVTINCTSPKRETIPRKRKARSSTGERKDLQRKMVKGSSRKNKMVQKEVGRWKAPGNTS